MHRFNESLEDYILHHTSPEDEVLKQLFRETNLKVMRPDMISGHLQGKMLEMFCRMIKPEAVLEIGTFTGYGTICMARGIGENSILHTIEINDELSELAQKYFEKSGVSNKIIQHTGDSILIIPKLPLQFDMVFIDGDKREYTRYYEVVFPKVKIGGFIISDDVLWYGKVNTEPGHNDRHTRNLKEYNQLLASDPRLENVMLPIRDGLMISRKINE